MLSQHPFILVRFVLSHDLYHSFIQQIFIELTVAVPLPCYNSRDKIPVIIEVNILDCGKEILNDYSHTTKKNKR